MADLRPPVPARPLVAGERQILTLLNTHGLKWSDDGGAFCHPDCAEYGHHVNPYRAEALRTQEENHG